MAATRGTPLQGSRSAHDVTDPDLHASDIEDAAFTVHMDPDAAEGEAMVMGGAGKYVATDVLTPTEHTAIGDDSPHHAAVTLGAGSDADMATLAAQALTVVLKDHDHSGDSGDGGTFDAANLTAGASTDGQVLTSDGAGGTAWEDAAGGTPILPILAADPVAPAEGEAWILKTPIMSDGTPLGLLLAITASSITGYTRELSVNDGGTAYRTTLS